MHQKYENKFSFKLMIVKPFVCKLGEGGECPGQQLIII